MTKSKELREMIEITIEETLKKADSIILEQQRAAREETFKNTEKLLYCYNALKEHVADEKEYLDMINKRRSGSIIRHSKNRAEAPDEERLLENRTASYNRSRNDVERIEKALNRIKDKQGYEVIRMRYLQRKRNIEDGKETEEVYTFEEIADILRGQQGFSKNLNEKTVRSYRTALIHEMAVFLFGSAAI